jgi:hypothetical protein
MKKSITLVFLAAVSFSAAAQVEICQLLSDGTAVVDGKVSPKGTVLASVNSRKLNGGNCDSWRKEKAKDFSTQRCVLLADGKRIFEGHGETPPKRGTEIVAGMPKPGQSCNEWREEKAASLING